MIRLLVSGGRSFWEPERAYAFLDSVTAEFGGVSVVIHGDAPDGGDQLAEMWARLRGVPTLPMPAEWRVLGRKAGFRRNTQMLAEAWPDVVAVLPGGGGTNDMLDKARAAGLPYRVMPGRINEAKVVPLEDL